MQWNKGFWAAALAALTLAGCGGPGGGSGAGGARPAGGGPSAPAPAPVHVATAETARVPVEVTAFGSAESISTVELRAQVSGEVVEVLFREGDAVTAGQELFRIDPRPFEVALAQAEANVARFEAELKQAQAMLRENEVRARNADVEHQRNETLLAREIVTQEEFDRSRTAAEAARASAIASDAAVNSARENIRAAQAAIEHARLDLERSVLRSPMDGRTGNLMIHRGDIVSASSPDPMVVITQIKPIYVSFTLPERYLSELRAADAAGDVTVRATIPQSGQDPVSGVLSFIDNQVERVTSTIRLKATFDNESETLWPGQYVDVRVELDVLENVITVPSQAVQTSQDGRYVYVISRDGIAELRPVTTGALYEGSIVITEGLQAGEVVVIDGHLRVLPGGPVKVLDDAGGQEQGGTEAASAEPAAS